MMFIHWRIDYLLEYYLADMLPADKRVSLESHLETCKQCQLKLAEKQKFIVKVKESTQLYMAPEENIDKIHNLIRELPAYSASSTPVETVQETKIPLFQWNRRLSYAAVAIIITLNLAIWMYSAIPRLTPIRIAETLGQGIWKQSPGSSNWKKVDSNTILNPGDNIKTDDFTRVALKLGKSGQVWVNRNSVIQLFSDSSTALNVNNGQIYVAVNHVKNGFRVNTPAGLVQVLGTEFNVTVNPDQRTVVNTVLHSVYFSNQYGVVTVQSGYQTIAIPQSAPSTPASVDDSQSFTWKRYLDKFQGLSIEERKQLRPAYITQGDMLFQNKKYEDSLESFRNAAGLDPDYYSPFYGMGLVYKSMGNYSLATTAYTLAIERNPDYSPAYFQLAQTLVELKQFASAEQITLQLTKNYSDNHANWVLLGNIYRLEGKLDLAQSAYQKAIDLGADNCSICEPQLSKGMELLGNPQKI